MRSLERSFASLSRALAMLASRIEKSKGSSTGSAFSAASAACSRSARLFFLFSAVLFEKLRRETGYRCATKA